MRSTTIKVTDVAYAQLREIAKLEGELTDQPASVSRAVEAMVKRLSGKFIVELRTSLAARKEREEKETRRASGYARTEEERMAERDRKRAARAIAKREEKKNAKRDEMALIAMKVTPEGRA